MLEACLKFSQQMVAARIAKRSKVDKRKEDQDIKIMLTGAAILSIKTTVKKIKQHGKD